MTAQPALFVEDAHGMYRPTDTATAANAAVVAISTRADGKRKVLRALAAAGDHGMTDFEHLAINGLHQTTAGKRRKDLQDDGLVRRACADDGTFAVRPSTTTGTSAAVWCLTTRGYIEAGSVVDGNTP